MDKMTRDSIEGSALLGRTIWKVFGDNAPFSDSISAGFARFSLANGRMLTHKHERELIYVVDAKGASARYGMELENLTGYSRLEAGDLLRFHDDEWHIFEMEDEESYLDIIWVYSVPTNHTTYAEAN